MLKQIRQWQNAFTITLILMCVGIGLGHDIDAALDQNHGELCSICIFGNTPALLSAEISFDFGAFHRVFEDPSFPLEYHNEVWPGYVTRAPPLV